MKANRLYWLGRYEQRVYLTLHLLRQCYDKMIDGEPEEYKTFWQKLDIFNNYETEEEFQQGMMFDDSNISSVISAQLRAQDNAILLREDIMSETLSYIEMSVALMRRLKAEKTENITLLQDVTDWCLAFWGSAEQRVLNTKALTLMLFGRDVENIDFLLRYNYPFERIMRVYQQMIVGFDIYPDVVDEHIRVNIESMLTEERYNEGDFVYKTTLQKYFSQLVRV